MANNKTVFGSICFARWQCKGPSSSQVVATVVFRREEMVQLVVFVCADIVKKFGCDILPSFVQSWEF